LTRLTKIHFLLEEFDLSLEYNENILDLAPEYRDSLLGKDICLGYLGRHEEALNILNMLIELGMYLMGESHYWLAWNQHEIGQQELAWENIKRASNYLIGHFEVHSLAGVIAFDRAKIEASEEQFKKALWMNKRDCEASFYMGKIYGLRSEWEQSGIHFENAALCNSAMERALQKKIKELEDSSLNPSRKESQINKKNIQMRKVQVTKATAFYNAAAGYFNVGQNEKALELAQNAKESKALKPKVDELINKIKEKTRK
jgi:tetratricopeptide (TPR) repeat protein